MVSDAFRKWWPDLGAVVDGLRFIKRDDVAERVMDAVRASAMGSEALGNVGSVLREHDAVRGQLHAAGKRSWDSVMADVYRGNPLCALRYRLVRLVRR